MTKELSVLVITTIHEARRRGAAFGTCHHHDKRTLQFWWPRLGREMLAGREFDVVIIAIAVEGELREWLTAHLTRRGRTGTIVVEGQLW